MSDPGSNHTERLTGGCQCGAVRYALASRPEAPDICHCRMCQKAGGAPFMAFARVPLGSVTWTRGAPATYQSSTAATRGFCSACGTPLTFQWRPDAISFTTGSFDNPQAVSPLKQLGLESRLDWTTHIADLPAERSGAMQTGFTNFQHPDHDS